MTLRTRILLSLFLFGLTPLLVAVLINLPLVLGRVELFYRHAYLQNLRADFGDLDQHLASRDEMLRLLTKLPEPGLIMGRDRADAVERIDLARARYTEWINRVLAEQRDITHVQFLDAGGVPRFWLERDPNSGEWTPPASRPATVASQAIQEVLRAEQPGVMLAPLRIDPQAAHPSRELSLQLLGPIRPEVDETPLGVVVMTVDVGGLARRDPDTLWVYDDGRYLQIPGLQQPQGSAFERYPGLAELFARGTLDLWEGRAQQIIWVPLFRTEDERPLWLGRPVDLQPLRAFEGALVLRVTAIVFALILVMWLVSRWFAARAEQFGQQLLEGIRATLEKGEPATFNWQGATELRQLGDNLTRLTATHARNVRSLRAHARELEQSNRYKSEFLANVSHELRTPLNSILLLSKLLREKGALSAKGQQQAGVIHEAAADLQALIDNILDLSRIEAGRLELQRRPVELPRLLEDIEALMAPQFEAAGLALTLVVDPGAPREILGDADKIRQVLKNFLGNAVKFTARGGATLHLAPAPAPYAVALSVTDTGIGIAADQQQRIFEAFQQADGAINRRYGGTGLGLTISRELAHLLGGEIQVQSAPGSGATFTLQLPDDVGIDRLDAEAQPETAQQADEPVASPPTPLPALAGGRVLLWGLDVRNLLAVTPWLEAWGASVLAVDDAAELGEALEEAPPRVLLLDPRSAEGDACVTLQRLRDILQEQQVRVLALGDGAVGAESGPRTAAAPQTGPEPWPDVIHGVLPMPLSRERLAQALLHALDEERPPVP